MTSRQDDSVASGIRECPVCGIACLKRGVIGSLKTTGASELSRAEFTLTYCTCGDLIYISPLPTPEDLRSMYVHGKQFGDGSVYRNEQHAASALQYYEERTLALLSTADGKTAGEHAFLEIGAGLSWICRVAKRINGKNKTVAQDVSPECMNECSWVDHYFVGDITDPRIDGQGPYNVISMTHVIEHLADPVAMLRRARDLLKLRGTIFITAPYRPVGWSPGDRDINRWASYSYNHVPAHLQYLSAQSLAKAAGLAGLKVTYWNSGHDNSQAFEAWLVHEAR